MRRWNTRFLHLALVALFAAGWTLPVFLRGQSIADQLPEIGIQHAAGQNVQPFFEGWQRNGDGSISMWFGYLNRNFKEQLDVPVGPNNTFEPGGDRGQPTHFYPRRHQFVFKIDLPKDWNKDQKLVWTMTAHGRTSIATGWMQPEWEIDDGVRQMNTSFGATPPVDPPNVAPTITGSPDQKIELGKSVKLTASATDDGLPKPRGPRASGLWIRWILYRGSGEVAFEPERTTPVTGKPVEMTTDATFSAPGMYWLRAIASDGMFETNHDVRVTVTARASTQSSPGNSAQKSLPYVTVDHPEFVPASQARFLGDGDRVIGVMDGNVAKAYAAADLAQHGVVQDRLKAGPIAVTW